MFERVWLFTAAPGREAEFETVYGPTGAWTQLFAQSPGYRGTELEPRPEIPRHYIVTDRWESREAWDTFRRGHATAYEALDRRCESLTDSETLTREGDTPAS